MSATIAACGESETLSPGPDGGPRNGNGTEAGVATDGGPDAIIAADAEAGPGCGDTSSNPDHCGSCGHSCGGGACKAGMCQAEIIQKRASYRTALTVDDASVYWSSCLDSQSNLWKASKEPSQTHTALAPWSSCEFLLAWGNSVYEASSTAVMQTDKVTGTKRQILSGDKVLPHVIGAGTTLYYSDGNDIFAVPITGGTPVSITEDNVYDSYYVQTFAITNSELYLAGGLLAGGSNRIFKQSLAPRAKPITLDYPDYPSQRMAVSGANVVSLYTSRASSRCGDATTRMEIFITPTSGGSGKTLVSRPTIAYSMLVDGDTVYWQDYCDSSLWKMPVSGGTPVRIHEGEGKGGESIAMDAKYIYFTDTTTIKRVAK